MLTGSAEAEISANRFCIKPLFFDLPLEDPSVYGLNHFIDTGRREHDLFFFRGREWLHPTRLVGQTFVLVEEAYPSKYDGDDIVVTADGAVYGLGGGHSERSIYRMSSDSGRFDKIEVAVGEYGSWANFHGLYWSTPLNSMLLTRSPSVEWRNVKATFRFDGSSAHRFPKVKGGITHVTDLPEFDLTVLVSGAEGSVYVIDGDQNVHHLTDLRLNKWSYISRTLVLSDPPRLLLEANEALGPFRGLFLIQLEQIDGKWRPAEQQDWTNLLHRFLGGKILGRGNLTTEYDPFERTYFVHAQGHDNRFKRVLGHLSGAFRIGAEGLYTVGENQLLKLDQDDPDLVETLPGGIRYAVSAEFGPERRFENHPSGPQVVLKRNSILVRDKDGIDHVPDGHELVLKGERASLSVFPLGQREEFLILSKNAPFLLVDRRSAGFVDSDQC